jgi:hypothetical protein
MIQDLLVGAIWSYSKIPALQFSNLKLDFCLFKNFPYVLKDTVRQISKPSHHVSVRVVSKIFQLLKLKQVFLNKK